MARITKQTIKRLEKQIEDLEHLESPILVIVRDITGTAFVVNVRGLAVATEEVNTLPEIKDICLSCFLIKKG